MGGTKLKFGGMSERRTARRGSRDCYVGMIAAGRQYANG